MLAPEIEWQGKNQPEERVRLLFNCDFTADANWVPVPTTDVPESFIDDQTGNPIFDWQDPANAQDLADFQAGKIVQLRDGARFSAAMDTGAKRRKYMSDKFDTAKQGALNKNAKLKAYLPSGSRTNGSWS